MNRKLPYTQEEKTIHELYSENPNLVTIQKAAKALKVSKDTLRRWEAKGKISSIRTTSGYRLYDLKTLSKAAKTKSETETPKPQFQSKTPIVLPLTSQTPLKTSPHDHSFYEFTNLNPEIVKLPSQQIEQPIVPVKKVYDFSKFSQAQNRKELGAFGVKQNLKVYGAALVLAIILSTLLSVASVYLPGFNQTRPARFIAGVFQKNPENIKPSQEVALSNSKPEVLAASSIAREGKFLQLNLDTNIVGNLAVEGEGVFTENLTAPNILYSLVAGNNITITGDAQNPTISTDLALEDATTTTKGIASFSSTFFTVTAGAVSIADSSITNTQIKDGTITNSDLTNTSITINAGSGLSGGGTVALGGSISISATGTTAAVTSITGTSNQVIASASTGEVTLSLPQNIALTSSPTFAGMLLSGSTSGTVTLNANAVTTSYTLTLPADDGTSGYVLQTDGSGNTSWVAQSGGGAGDLQGAYNTGNTILTTTGRNIAFTLASGLATSTSLSLTNAGTANAFILNDTNAASNISLDIRSAGTSSLTITESGTITTTGNISTSTGGTIYSDGTLTASNGFTMSTGALNITSSSGSVSSTGLTGLTYTLSSGTAAITAPTLNLNTASTGATAIGNSTGTFALTSNGGLNVTTGGALTGVASIDTIAVNATSLTFAGAGTIASTTIAALTLDSGTTGIVNLGTGNNAKTINIGTGTAGNIINVGTNNTVADAINIGSALDTTILAGTVRVSGLSVSSAVYTDGSSNLTSTAPSSGTIGYWSRTGTTLSTATSGDAVTTSGNISTSGSGTVTSASTLTASSGLTMTTGALNLTSTSGAISSTGLTALTYTLSSGTAAITAPTLNLNTASTGNTAIGNATGTFSVTSNGGLNLSTAGALTGVASINTIAVSSTALTFAAGGTLNATSGGLNLQADGAIDVNIAGGSGSTGCTVANSTGNLTCTGNISGASTGTAGYWSRSGTTLTPATANDIATISTNAASGTALALTSSAITTSDSAGLTNTVTITGTGTGASFYGANTAVSSTQALTGTTAQTLYGNYTSLTKTGADTTSGTLLTYGTYSTASNTGGNASATRGTRGGYFAATGDTSGTTTAIGIDTRAGGADTSYGIDATAYNTTAGTYASLYGGNIFAYSQTGSTTITTAVGVNAGIQNILSTMTTAYGMRVLSASNTSGTISTNYGLMVEPQTAGGADYGARIDAADTQTLWLSGNADNTTAAAGIAFGSSRDTNLYRSAADTLRTDDAFTATGLITGSTGLTITGGIASLNASSNFATNINTGTSNGAITIGNSSAGAIALSTGSTFGVTTTTSPQTYTSAVVTGATTASGFVFNASALTTGTALYLTSTATSGKLFNINATNTSGTISSIGYGAAATLSGSLTAEEINLSAANLTATNQSVTGTAITIPTVTNTITTGTKTLTGISIVTGNGSGINQNGAGGTTNFLGADITIPALTQTAGTLNAYGVQVTTPATITTGGTTAGMNVVATGVGAGSLYGLNVGSITGGAGTEYALNVGTGWDAVLRVGSTTVINGSGVTQVPGGGTGLATVTQNGVVYGNAASNLGVTAAGTTGQVLIATTGSAPSWGSISGSTCTNCVVTDPAADQTIAPTGAGTTGLTVRQTSTASPTDDIFQVTNSAGTTKYFYVDKDGNVSTASTAGQTLTLTPLTDTTALTLVGTNVTTQPLQYINAKNSSATSGILNMAYGAAHTLTGTVIGFRQDLSTNVTATNQSVTGYQTTLPAATNTNTSGTVAYKGLAISGGALNANGTGGATTYSGLDIAIPALTQTLGTLTAYGANITTPSSITTGGTAYGYNVAASGVGAGTLYGLNISDITAGAGTEVGAQIGSGWDTNLLFNDTTTNIAVANGGTITIADSAGNSLCTITDAGTTGNLSCSGTIGGSGTVGFWSKSGTTLSPATANDIVSIANTTTTGADLAITNTGVYTGTGIFNLTANSATTGTVGNLSATGLTTGTGLKLTGGTALTTGGLLSLTSASYNHSGAETGSVASLAFTDATTNVVTSTTNGLLISPTISAGSGAATRTINGINVAPTFTSCAAGTCAVNGINVAGVTDGTGFTGTALNIAGTGWDTDISLQNAETISNATDGTITLGVTGTSALNIGSTGISSIGNVAHTIVNSSGALAIDSNSTGAINIGTGANAKTITLGNATGATALAFNSGTGSQTFTSQVVSGTTTTSAFVFSSPALTTGTGSYFTSSTITQGKLLQLSTGAANTLTTGTLADIRTTATSLTGAAGTGSLMNLDWTPGSSTTATGDLFALNIGANGSTTGKLFNLLDSSASIFSVSETTFETSLPSNFTAPGDVSVSYDIQFTNPVASYIKSYSALTIQPGDPFGSSNLTLSPYNEGSVHIPSNVATAYGLDIDANLLSTGRAVDISSTSTAGGASGSSYLLYLDRSGANASATHTAYGLYSSVANTGTTNVNIGIFSQASGAITNYGVQTGAITSAASGTNYQLNLGAIAGAASATSASINTGAISGAGTSSSGITLGANSATATSNYGINIGAISGAGTTNRGINIGAVSGATNNYEIAFAGTSPEVAVADGGTITISDGTNTLCTIADAGTTGNLTCTGNITGSSSGTAGFWTRTSTTLSPATANDIVSIANTTTTGADLALTNTGVYTGTGIFNLTANSATTGTIAALSGTALTTGKVMTLTGGTALTTGGLLSLSGASYTHATAETGNVAQLSFSDASTNTSGSSVTNGFSISPTLNTSGAGTKYVNAFNVAAPTVTACTAGSCIISGLNVNTLTTGGASTVYNYGTNITATGISGGVLVGSNISSIVTGAGTEVGSLIGPGWDTGYGYAAGAAYTQTAAMIAADFNMSTNMTVPNSAAGNQTGLLVTLSDGGASATATGLSVMGTMDTGLLIGSGSNAITTGISLASTGITTDISLQNGETINNDVDGIINLAITGTSALQVGSTGISSLGNVAHTIVNSAGALAIDSATTGAINIGTGANAKTITVGNATGATALAFTSGTGSQTFTSSVATTATTSSAWVFTDNALTTGTGLYASSTSLTTGKLAELSVPANTMTTGSLLNLTTTSTGLTSATLGGSLLNLDWSPASATTATGDLFRLTIGTNGTTTGNLFNIVDTTSSIFSVKETAFETSLPTNFTAAGDVAIAYDINFTNPTASYIKSAAPLAIVAGETFNSSNLTLQTYNQGTIVLDTANTTTTAADLTSSTLTTGIGLNLANSNSSQTTATLLNVVQSGVTTGYTGNLVNITGTSTTGSGTLFNISSANTSAGNAMLLTANSLTGGTGLSAASSGTAVTGDLGKFELTGNSGSSLSGNALKVGITGTTASGNSTALNVTNGNTGATAYAARFNDDGTYTDSTPFVINGSGNVGIGTATPTEKLAVAGGNILIGAQTDSAGAFTLRSHTTAGTIVSGGTASITNVSSSAWYNGSLYVGTKKTGAAEVYRYNGSTGSWTVINTTPGTFNTTAAIDDVSAMTVYDGYLYIGTDKSNAGEVYRYDGSTGAAVFTAINTTAGRFQTGTSINKVSSMAVHNGYLFIGTSEANAGEVYRYNGNGTGTSVFTSLNATAGTFIAQASVDTVSALVSFKGDLYYGLTEANGGNIYKYKDDGNSIVRVTTATGQIGVGGQASVDGVTSFTIYNGALYAGTTEANAAEVWRYLPSADDDSGPKQTWQRVVNAAGTIIASGTASIDTISAMGVYNGMLYIGTSESNSAQIYRWGSTTNGNFWTVMNGVAGTLTSTASIDTIQTITQYNGDLFIGTTEGTSAESYSYNEVESNSYALKFNAASDNGSNAEANSLLNTGMLYFQAERQNTAYAGSNNSGSFVFSHGITGVSGSYDVAEDYPSRDESLTPGDIVAIDDTETGFVQKATGTYNTKLLGIYSEKPGLRLSQKDAFINGGRAIPVALAGRVPVRISTESGVIRKGDLLTSSSLPGVAMKATRSGQIIGKALEDFAGSEIGKVMAFVNVSYADPNNSLANLTLDDKGNLIVPEITAGKLVVSGDIKIAGIVSASEFALDASAINRVGVLASLPVDAQNRASVADTLNLLAQAANEQESRIDLLAQKEASTAAALADAKVLGEQALTQTSSLQDSVASTSATIANLSSQIEELFASITGNSSPSEASPSDQLINQSPDQLALTPPTVMFASDSATLDTLTVNSQATVSGQLTAYDGIFQNSLKSLGDTFLGKTNIAGDLTVDGTFSVTEGSKVNALPILYFQTSALAETVDFFNGLVTITKDGAIAAKEIITERISVKADSSAGTVILTAGETEMPVLNELVEDDSIIILTSETTGAPSLAVADKVEGAGFVVKLGAPYTEDIKFSYLIIGQK